MRPFPICPLQTTVGVELYELRWSRSLHDSLESILRSDHWWKLECRSEPLGCPCAGTSLALAYLLCGADSGWHRMPELSGNEKAHIRSLALPCQFAWVRLFQGVGKARSLSCRVLLVRYLNSCFDRLLPNFEQRIVRLLVTQWLEREHDAFAIASFEMTCQLELEAICSPICSLAIE
jgi:hypothetical protein